MLSLGFHLVGKVVLFGDFLGGLSLLSSGSSPFELFVP